MLYGIVLRDYPEQVLSLAKAKSVSANMREFLSWAQRQYRIDVTVSTVERKIGGLASPGACPDGCKCFSRKKFERAIHQVDVPDLLYRSVGKNVIHHDKTQLHVLIDTWITGEATHTRGRHTVSIVELTLILFRARPTKLSRQHVQLLRTVMKSLRIVYRGARRSRSNKSILRQG